MRELKFRIWDKQNKTWLENSSSLHCFSNWSICPFTGKLVDYVGVIDGDYGDKYTASPAPDYYIQDGKIVNEPRYVIQQYIGMKDKNNVEIYEGDICAFSDWKLKPIVWRDGFFRLGNTDVLCCKMECDNMEIIGNIFENIDLMKARCCYQN